MPYNCPNCGQNGRAANFRIKGRTPMWVEIDDSGDVQDTDDPNEDTEWTGSDPMECLGCNHEANVSDFETLAN